MDLRGEFPITSFLKMFEKHLLNSGKDANVIKYYFDTTREKKKMEALTIVNYSTWSCRHLVTAPAGGFCGHTHTLCPQQPSTHGYQRCPLPQSLRVFTAA